MPKMPGRKSVKTKLPIEQLVAARFFMAWEDQFYLFECVVEGCDHRIGECPGAGQAGYLYDEEQYWRDDREGTRKARGGPGCPCCTARLLAS